MPRQVVVYAPSRFGHLSELARAVDIVNSHQTFCRLDIEATSEIPEIAKRSGVVDGQRVFAAKAKIYGSRPCFVVTRRPLVGGLFSDADPYRCSLISTSEWESRFPKVPLFMYLAWMMATNLPFLLTKLSDSVCSRMDERHAGKTSGCVSDYCPLIFDTWRNMLNTHVCAPCKADLMRSGFPKSAALQLDTLLLNLKRLNRLYDKKLSPDVFVSYSHADQRFAIRLSADLLRHGYKTWLDERELRVGDSLFYGVSAGIDKSRVFLPLFSPASMKSEWCRKELGAAFQRELAKKTSILPVMYKKCEIPSLLADKVYLDITNGKHEEKVTALVSAIRKAKLRRREKRA